MKLLYLWVEDYGILKDAEFNFDSNIRFHYDCEKNELKRIEAKNEIPKNFFSLNNSAGNVVESVSAIIGNNGAGKTSVFRLINRVLWNDVGINFIFIFKTEQEKGEKQDGWFYFKTSGEYYKIKEFNSGEVLNLKDKNDSFVDLKKNNRQDEKPFTLIYHSQFFNPQEYDWVGDSTIDISTTHLMTNDYEWYYNTGTVLKGKTPPHNKLKAHSAMEFIRNINFIKKVIEWEKKGRKFDFGFNYTAGVTLKINEDEEAILTYQMKKGLKEISDCFDDFKKIYKNELPVSETTEKNKVSREIFLFNLSKSIIFNFLRGNASVLKPSSVTINYWRKLQETLDEEKQKNSASWRKVFNNYFTKMSTPFDVTVKKESGEEKVKYSDNKASMILDIMKIFEKIPDNYFTYLGGDIRFDFLTAEGLNSEGFDLFKKIINLYFETNTITHYMLFNWYPQISAGEQSYLNIFSRFISIFETDWTTRYNYKDLIIFFDEIETTLHPEWQRTLVKNLIKFFEEFFIEDDHKKHNIEPKHIHLIFATHSPILLSDIPVGNCCFLKREEGTFITKVEENKNTTAFGSNIYNLYRDSFFMKNGLMGLFAEEKLKEVFDIFKKNAADITEIERDFCKKVIANIGEAIIKRELERKLLSNLNEDERIKYYENEIRKLKEKQNDSDKK